MRSSLNPDRLRRTSPLRSFRFGEYQVTHIPDGLVQMNPRIWFAESSDDDWSSRADHLDRDGFLVGSIGSLLVQHDGRALLIDAGYGPHQVPAERSHPALGRLAGGDLLDGLRQAGLDPGDVDVLALTHLHDDHIGWAFANTPTGPVFGNATVVASAAEWASSGHVPVPGRQVRAVDGQEIFPGVTVWLTPGHTAGHSAYVISAGERRLIAFGDVMHTPVQIGRPEWRSVFDLDHDAAVRSRLAVIAALAEPGSVGYGVHFADALFGRVLDGGAPRWAPADDLLR